MNDAPMLPAEVAAFEAALRRAVNDSALSVRWNPQSYITRPGHFDVYGKPIPPSREGRWEIHRAQQDGSSFMVWQVRDPDTEAYRPLGEWAIDFLRKWDRANVAAQQELKRLYDEEDAAREAADLAFEEEQREHWSRQAVDRIGIKTLIGRGATFH